MKPEIPNNPVTDWSDYYRATLSKPLHPLFLELEPLLPATGRAIDLGCGVGHAVLWLANKGWQVEAVDGHPEALSILKSRLNSEVTSRVTCTQSRLENVELEPDSLDLVVAAFSLFFVESHEALNNLWHSIHTSLVPGGLFLGEFLGPRDDWADRYLTHSRSEVDQLLADWQGLHFEEAEQDGLTSQGTPKHWHVYHVIAQKAPFSISRAEI